MAINWGTVAQTGANLGAQAAMPSYGQGLQRGFAGQPGNTPAPSALLSKGAGMAGTIGTTALSALPGPWGTITSGLIGAGLSGAQDSAAEDYKRKMMASAPGVAKGKLKSMYTKGSGSVKAAGMAGLNSPLSGAATGASYGSMIAPGVGTLIGAGIGGVAGLLGSKRAKADQKKQMAAAQKIQKQNQGVVSQGQRVAASQPGAGTRTAAAQGAGGGAGAPGPNLGGGGGGGSPNQRPNIDAGQDRTTWGAVPRAMLAGGSSNGPRQPRPVPAGNTQSNLPYNIKASNYRKWGGGLQNLLRSQIEKGLDPRILGGLENAATGSAQDTRQTLNDTFGRTGDMSGYDYGVPAGMSMAAGREVANVRPQFRQQEQAYINDLISQFRSTRGRGTAQQLGAAGGGNLGGILQAGAGLGQAAATAYAGYQGAHPQAPAPSPIVKGP